MSPVSQWRTRDLATYNISIKNQQAKEFFGQDLPDILEGVDPELLTSNVCKGGATNDDTHRVLTYLNLATYGGFATDSAIPEFTRELLRTLGFEDRGYIHMLRYTLPLFIQGEVLTPQLDACILHRSITVILVICHDDNTSTLFESLDSRVVLGAIAAFQKNNENRSDLGGWETLDKMEIPCLVMMGTRPVFYVVPVTKQLNFAIESGQPCELRTEVRKCIAGPSPIMDMNESEFRIKAIKHFVLFKSLVEKLSSQFIQDLQY